MPESVSNAAGVQAEFELGDMSYGKDKKEKLK
jgi:hypothetical protein